MTARTAELASEHRAWLDDRVYLLRHELTIDDVLARRRAPRALVYRERRPRSLFAPLVDALLAGGCALLLVGVITLVVMVAS